MLKVSLITVWLFTLSTTVYAAFAIFQAAGTIVQPAGNQVITSLQGSQPAGNLVVDDLTNNVVTSQQ
jgi:hypothetical protein